MRELTGVQCIAQASAGGGGLATVGLCHLFTVRQGEGGCVAAQQNTTSRAGGYLLHTSQQRLDNLEQPIFSPRLGQKRNFKLHYGLGSQHYLSWEVEVQWRDKITVSLALHRTTLLCAVCSLILI